MARAIELARGGEGFVSPNPMVGAVIVCDGRIIGEGFHRRFGGPHAEVNAVNSVKDKTLLPQSTIYVTLEPCSHFGKTPPCALLLKEVGIRRIVVGCGDPNPKVAGRGIEMLRQAGREVKVGVLERECFELNRAFMTSKLKHRPYVTLKWACSADGYLDRKREPSEPAERFSTPLTTQTVQLLRSRNDAILVGSSTVIADDPRLDVRTVYGRQPLKVVLDRRGRVPATARVFNPSGTDNQDKTVLYFGPKRTDLPATVEIIETQSDTTLSDVLSELDRRGIISLLVEGGATLHRAFIDASLWDCARIEIAPRTLADKGAAYLPIPSGATSAQTLDGNTILNVTRE